MDYSFCWKLANVIFLNLKAMISARVKVRKMEFYIVLARKHQKCIDRAPLTTDNQRNYEMHWMKCTGAWDDVVMVAWQQVKD